eukprot:4360937-Pyramimonas_sp.AAC.1
MQCGLEACGAEMVPPQAGASADPKWGDSPAFLRPPAGVDLPEEHGWRLKRGQMLRGLRRAARA